MEEEEEEKIYLGANAVNEEDPERDRATQDEEEEEEFKANRRRKVEYRVKRTVKLRLFDRRMTHQVYIYIHTHTHTHIHTRQESLGFSAFSRHHFSFKLSSPHPFTPQMCTYMYVCVRVCVRMCRYV